MSLKKSFSADGKKCTVVFNVNANAAENADKVYLVGEFNSWNETSIPMKKGPDGSFSVKKQLDTNKEYQFRYLLDGKKWINDWKADKVSKKPAPKSAAKKTTTKKEAAPKTTAKKTTKK